jgi:hypothetical protein
MNKHRSLLNYLATLCLLLALATVGTGCKNTSAQNREVETDARAQQEFNNRMGAYVSIHRQAANGSPHIKSSPSGANLVQQQQALAGKIQAARTFGEGSVFTPDVSAYFRRQIEAAYMANGGGIQAGLDMTEREADQKIVVNQPFPHDLAHTSMPPTVLLRLPKLTNCMQYEIANHDLVIRDMESNLVVDVLRNAIP